MNLLFFGPHPAAPPRANVVGRTPEPRTGVRP